MRIKAIEAKGFRTLEDFYIQLQPNYCAISGRNNAGKSAIISIIQFFLDDYDEFRFNPFNDQISFSKDSTQWRSVDDMEISIEISINRIDDSELFFFVERFVGTNIDSDTASVGMKQKFTSDGSIDLKCNVNENNLDYQSASEILKKFRSSQNLVLHNSTDNHRNFYFYGSSNTELLETTFTAEDRKKYLMLSLVCRTV